MSERPADERRCPCLSRLRTKRRTCAIASPSVSFAEEIVVISNDIPSEDNEVHEHLLLNGRVEYLSASMEHYAFPNVATFVEKHDRYSSWEAASRRKLDSSRVSDAEYLL